MFCFLHLSLLLVVVFVNDCDALLLNDGDVLLLNDGDDGDVLLVNDGEVLLVNCGDVQLTKKLQKFWIYVQIIGR